MDQERVLELARLSRLELSSSELDRAEEQIGRLLAYFAELQEVDTEGIDASPYPCPIPHRLRDDEPGPVLSQARVLANAPSSRAGQFRVPRVVDS